MEGGEELEESKGTMGGCPRVGKRLRSARFLASETIKGLTRWRFFSPGRYFCWEGGAGMWNGRWRLGVGGGTEGES